MHSKHKQLRDHCEALLVTAQQSDPWVFLCASAYIEFLSRMTMTGENKYSDFVRTYLSRINKEYDCFTYRNGSYDLPEQMWYVLRNGLLHTFTLKPNRQNVGRENSILLTHEGAHLSHHPKVDGCVLNAYQLIRDLIAVTDMIFTDTLQNVELEKRVLNFCNEYPPLGVV